MYIKTHEKDLRKACVEARRSLGHIVGCIDLDVPDLVDVIIDTIVKEAQK